MQRPLADVILIFFLLKTREIRDFDNKHVIAAQQPFLPLPNPQQG